VPRHWQPIAPRHILECRNIQQETDMTARIPENIPALLVDWSLVTIMGDMLPPRDPNDDDDEDEEDEEDEDEKKEPPVIREPEEE
jgi:hypothetical protein